MPRLAKMGRMSLVPLLAASLPTASHAAAGEVLLICTDDIPGGDAACKALVEALRSELAELDIGVESSAAVPAEVEEAASQPGASCVIRMDRGDGGLVFHVYTPGSLQTVTEIVPRLDADGALDIQDAAFRLRTLVAASLFFDLPGLEPPVEAPAPVEEEPAIEIQPEPPAPAEPLRVSTTVRRPWVRLHAGYLLASYPIESHWYHGIALSIGILPIPELEIFLDAGVTFPNSLDLGSTAAGQPLEIENSQHVLGLGIGYSFPLGSRVSITPRIGFHLGISDTLVRTPERKRYRELNTAIWAGLELRVVIVSLLSFHLGTSIENLFNYEYFEDDSGPETRTLFSLSQLRMGFYAGLSLRF